MKIIVTGSSARALAYSVAAAGHEPLAVDSFGDSDLVKIASWRRLDKNEPLSGVVGDLGAEGAVFASGVENRPEVIGELERAGIKVFSSSADSIRRCRDLAELERFCAANKIYRPETIAAPGGINKPEGYLVKPAKSGAGIGVRRLNQGERLRSGEYLQRIVEGTPMSAVFLSDGRNASLCGISRQLVGETSLGCSGFAWCGNIMPFDAHGDERSTLLSELRRITSALVSWFGLSGAAGVDFIYGGGKLYLLEVNPRISASFELVELLRGVNIFGLHKRALEGEIPPEFPDLLTGPFRGKGIIYSPEDSTSPDTSSWYNCSRRDIPREGAILPAGLPVCTAISPPMESFAEVMDYLCAEAKNVWRECGL